MIVALPVWLLTLPLVIALKDAQGWRGWVILLTGVSLGPALMLAWTLISSGGRLNWRGNGYVLIASLTISVVTTCI
jgi:hypothetical protein